MTHPPISSRYKTRNSLWRKACKNQVSKDPTFLKNWKIKKIVATSEVDDVRQCSGPFFHICEAHLHPRVYFSAVSLWGWWIWFIIWISSNPGIWLLPSAGKLDQLVLNRPSTGATWISANRYGNFVPVYQQGHAGNEIREIRFTWWGIGRVICFWLQLGWTTRASDLGKGIFGS